MALMGSVKPLVLYLTDDEVRELERLDIPRAIWGDDVLDDGFGVDHERLRFAGSAGCVRYDEKTEKRVAQDRRLDCCGRIICGNCIENNKRFATYCPFCQVSSQPSPLPQGLRDPPAYSASSPPHEQPPAYSPVDDQEETDEKHGHNGVEVAEDVLHFVDPARDTISSLALRYAVPANALRTKNHVYADHLLAARKAILIPGEFYKGVSLSPQPIDGEDEEIRKSKIRRWMVTCKVSDYNVAVLYLEQAKYELDAAVEAYLADEQWERDHPIQTCSKSKTTPNRTRRAFGL
ncbi:MAG: hypothetical protein Q9180_002047 [Flavoplaca navasiana]